ncbi:hypothetical protein MMG00_02520 [Ignatzschineria rhizosphaerae]|uniref:Uncharacterized protein n=1 Tax=Ignatzschineria rhizosphaerae TaxID=2923279 RepID=A0ABY3X1N3_9GAMM|nr:hypothetical protein [Ignatzschineria rhizosphaerae]UNM96749.1 hypothetical protein MMG00_02520 [Ignatzschineria rhizosphaerae]
MTDQEIIGVMSQFYIAKQGSIVSEFFIDHQANAVERCPALEKLLKVSSQELIFTTENEQRFSSIKPFENSESEDVYLVGAAGDDSTEEVKAEIEAGLLQPLTKQEYLEIYRGLEVDYE